MSLTLVTAPAIEPISLAEAKAHLRLDSAAVSGLSESASIRPGSHPIGTINGVSADVLGLGVLCVFNAGTCGAGGTVDVKIQESSDNTTFTDWTGGAFTQVTEANDNAVFEKEYTGQARYIRVVSTTAVFACEFGVSFILRQASLEEDALLNSLITVAREYAETVTGRALITQTWDLSLDDWPCHDSIDFPLAPLISVTSVKYKDTAGTEYTLSSSTYIVDINPFKERVVLGYGQVWPSASLYPASPITVRFVAGYGAARSLVPTSIRQAMLLYLATLYSQRDQIVRGQNAASSIPAPFTVDALLWPYRRF